jgi:hypothetical protein
MEDDVVSSRSGKGEREMRFWVRHFQGITQNLVLERLLAQQRYAVSGSCRLDQPK